MKIQKDKKQHFLSCLAIAFVMTLGMAEVVGATIGAASISGFLTAAGTGLGKEYGDSKAVGNRWDNMDIKYNLLGATVGIILASMIKAIIL